MLVNCIIFSVSSTIEAKLRMRKQLFFSEITEHNNKLRFKLNSHLSCPWFNGAFVRSSMEMKRRNTCTTMESWKGCVKAIIIVTYLDCLSIHTHHHFACVQTRTRSYFRPLLVVISNFEFSFVEIQQRMVHLRYSTMASKNILAHKHTLLMPIVADLAAFYVCGERVVGNWFSTAFYYAQFFDPNGFLLICFSLFTLYFWHIWCEL